MKETLITFETAQLAKKKGFDLETFYSHKKDYFSEKGEIVKTDDYYKNNTSMFPAPSQSLLQKWLRENHKIVVEPTLLGGLVSETNLFDCSVFYVKNKTVCESKLKVTHSYEEALEIGLIEALKLI